MHNPDLTFINSYSDAVKHYQNHGHKENRHHALIVVNACKRPAEGLPDDFNWVYYRVANSDLKEITTEQEAIRHYLEHGQRENRKYKSEPALLIGAKHGHGHGQGQGQGQGREQPAIIKPKIQMKPERTVVVPEKPRKSLKLLLPPVVTQKVELKLKKSQLIRQPSVVSTPTPSPGKIPNIIHFVYGFKQQQEPFNLTKYIAIMSAYHLNKPDRIYFYYKFEPFGPLWDQVKPLLTMVLTDPPETIFGNKVTRYAHKADIVRLQVLNEKGGIYLDIDTICLRPLAPLLDYDFVMGLQGDNYGLCNAVMMAKPNTEFGRNWMESYKSFNGRQWDLHSVKIPYNLSKIYPITILQNDAYFYPLWDPFPDLVLSDDINYDCCRKIFQNSYCLHLWESWCVPHLQKINELSINEYHSLYNLIGRKFLCNQVTLILILPEQNNLSLVAVIGSYYKILARNDVNQMIIYASDTQVSSFLDNLPNINPKFRVIYGTHSPSHCRKSDLVNYVTSGIVCLMTELITLTDESLIDTVVSYMYDESLGMLGITGGHINVSNYSEPFQKVEGVDKAKIVDYVTKLQIFRRELLYYNIKLDVDDIDLCFQIHNIGKSMVIMPPSGAQIISSIGSIQYSKDQLTDLFKKWKSS
jgi:hypothetical protein